LIGDIETSYNTVICWKPGRKLTIGPENVLREAKIICIAYKWAGEKRTYCLTWDEEQNDRKLILEFMKVMDSADEVVFHNGDAFDIKWIRTRCLKHRIPAFPKYTSIDTLLHCRRLFRMNSNKLNEVAKFLGIPGKMATGGLQLWKDVIEHKSPTALKKMMKYCKRDVVLLEEVFDILNPYMPARSRMDSDITTCPECGSSKLTVNQRRRYTPLGSERVSLRCLDCGKYPPAMAASRWDAATA